MGGQAHIIGVTGSPGSGKSTLVNALSKSLAADSKKVAILAVDPSSPFSGGAILGDRIRMAETANLDNVFIRSLATRGYLGGLSKSSFDAIQLCDSAGFDYIIIETVGVGQAEIDIAKIAHTCLLVLVPGMGDGVQAMKAGVLEIADSFILNKADKDGIDRLKKDIRMMLSLASVKPSWEPNIIETVAVESKGIDKVKDEIVKHRKWLTSTSEGFEKQVKIMETQLVRLLGSKVTEKLFVGAGDLISAAKDCVERKSDPYTLIDLEIEKLGLR